MGREIPCVLDVPPKAHAFFYQCLIRCDAAGRIHSFSACARAAGISESHRARTLKPLLDCGLIYKNEPPKQGGGFHLEKLVALAQEACALGEQYRHQFGASTSTSLVPPPAPIWCPNKSLKKKKDTRVTREGSFFDDTRSRSSLRYRNARQSQGWVEEEESPIRPLMNTSMDFV